VSDQRGGGGVGKKSHTGDSNASREPVLEGSRDLKEGGARNHFGTSNLLAR